MAERILTTKLVLLGKDEYVNGINEVAEALERVINAKETLDALFERAPNPCAQVCNQLTKEQISRAVGAALAKLGQP